MLFSSEILDAPVAVTGTPEVRLFVSSDCPDTDFMVRLTDVYPDGRSMLVADGAAKGRLRNGFDHEDMMDPNEVYEIVVRLPAVAMSFEAGHRIRAVVSSSNAPRFSKNPNTDDPIGASDATAQVATNTLYFGGDQPARLVLPVVAE